MRNCGRSIDPIHGYFKHMLKDGNEALLLYVMMNLVSGKKVWQLLNSSQSFISLPTKKFLCLATKAVRRGERENLLFMGEGQILQKRIILRESNVYHVVLSKRQIDPCPKYTI